MGGFSASPLPIPPKGILGNFLDFLQIMRPVRLAVENNEVRKSFWGGIKTV